MYNYCHYWHLNCDSIYIADFLSIKLAHNFINFINSNLFYPYFTLQSNYLFNYNNISSTLTKFLNYSFNFILLLLLNILKYYSISKQNLHISIRILSLSILSTFLLFSNFIKYNILSSLILSLLSLFKFFNLLK